MSNELNKFERIVLECYLARLNMPYSCHGGKHQRVNDAIEDAKAIIDGIQKFMKENE